MFVKVTDLAIELREKTAWQRTPVELTEYEYCSMIEYAIKTLFIDTGRAQNYNGLEENEGYTGITIGIDEQRYVLLVAQIEFFKKVQSDVNNIVSYTTDALSVTNADKPYVHLQDTITGLENERRRVFYKMRTYVYD